VRQPVLITPRRGFPRAKTTFELFDATLLQPRKTLTLRATSAPTRSHPTDAGST
jgi:hypothetical protein